jgi:hypothetical protein
LERVIVLRYLGLSLRDIAALLNTPGLNAEPLTITLARQQQARTRTKKHNPLRSNFHPQLEHCACNRLPYNSPMRRALMNFDHRNFGWSVHFIGLIAGT